MLILLYSKIKSERRPQTEVRTDSWAQHQKLKKKKATRMKNHQHYLKQQFIGSVIWSQDQWSEGQPTTAVPSVQQWAGDGGLPVLLEGVSNNQWWTGEKLSSHPKTCHTGLAQTEGIRGLKQIKRVITILYESDFSFFFFLVSLTLRQYNCAL